MSNETKLDDAAYIRGHGWITGPEATKALAEAEADWLASKAVNTIKTGDPVSLKAEGAFGPVNNTGIQPTEFKVLILPDAVEEVTKGGIILSTQTKDSEKYATIEGRIIAVSHLAFTYATAAEWGDHKPKPGDRVIFAKYAGVRHKAKDGQEYLLVNDKDIVAVVAE